METYKTIIKDRLDDIVENEDETRNDVLKRWAEWDTQNDFGNIDGSRTCSAYESEKTLQEAGWPYNYELQELVKEAGYTMDYLIERGPEVTDVIICELLAPIVANEMIEEK